MSDELHPTTRQLRRVHLSVPYLEGRLSMPSGGPTLTRMGDAAYTATTSSEDGPRTRAQPDRCGAHPRTPIPREHSRPTYISKSPAYMVQELVLLKRRQLHRSEKHAAWSLWARPGARTTCSHSSREPVCWVCGLPLSSLGEPPREFIFQGPSRFTLPRLAGPAIPRTRRRIREARRDAAVAIGGTGHRMSDESLGITKSKSSAIIDAS